VSSVPDHLKKENDNNRLTILAVDTATSTCSVALADPSGTIAELNYFGKQTHAKHLATMVDRLLAQADITLAAVAAFAVDAGPGTFTGLRIGMAAVKGLAAATRKPAVGVSSLDALANQVTDESGQICCMLDARRGEVYAARYTVRDGVVAKLTREEVLAPQSAVAAHDGPCLYIGSGAVVYRDMIADQAGKNARFAAGDENHIRAASIARLGLQKLAAGDTGRALDLVPNYIRRSDAEYNKMR